ncbi:phage minor capsid protein [Gemmiger formicilis]|uniref:phage minor capsid protein n=1 Tax=Gemmiger formicilis TaxID=745368 RepID=UPI003CCB20D5
MLTPEQLAQIADKATIRKLYDQLQEDIIADMARRLSKMDFGSYTTMWELQKLEAINAERDYIVQRLAETTGKSKSEIIAILNTGCSTALGSDDKVYRLAGYNPLPLAKSPALQALIWAGYKKTLGTFQNLTRTTANTATRQFEDALDRAYMQVTSGGMSYQQAVKGAVLDLAKNGLAAVQYSTGHVDYMDAAVRRAVLTGVNQTALKIQDARADEFGCDLVEVSAHYGARPTHAEWQGRIYSRSGKSRKYKDFVETTGYGSGDGLGGWNCRHSFGPFFEGISKPTYTEKDLREINSKMVEYNGQQMSLYDASQKQRANEREIRALKREQAGLEGAGQDASEVKAKLRDAQAKQRDFCSQTGLRRDYFRERGGKQNQQRSPNPERITVSQSRSTYSGSLQKLNFADGVRESDRKSIRKELSVLPTAQRELAETQISRVSVNADKTGSYYNPFTKEIVVSESRKAGDVIHEYGHALERACKVWKDPEYISVRADGIDLADLSKVVYDETTFTAPIHRLNSEKFISEYQGRLYRRGNSGATEIDLSTLKDYFSEGYRAYYTEPWLLKKKDPKLYAYIEGLPK